MLHACIQLDLFELLAERRWTDAALAERLGLAPERLDRLLTAAESLRLVRRVRGTWRLGRLGAASVGNDGVAAMVRHHDLLYADLADPVGMLRRPAGGGRLAAYWPYAGAADPAALRPDQVADYSALMAASQALVADEVLGAYDVRGHRLLLDVGGGEGAFLEAVARRAPALERALLDLPAVAERARARLGPSVAVHGQDMFAAEWPRGADLISLVRVVHDHDDDAVHALLRRAHAALHPGGTLMLAEPMAGAPGAEAVGAAYFAFYLLAMGTGRARRPAELVAMLRAAGFSRATPLGTANPLMSSLIVAYA